MNLFRADVRDSRFGVATVGKNAGLGAGQRYRLSTKGVYSHGGQRRRAALTRCEQNVQLAFCWAVRHRVREFDQIIGHACHRGNHRDDAATFALRFNQAARDVSNPFRIANRSAAVFLDNQTHDEKPRDFKLKFKRAQDIVDLGDHRLDLLHLFQDNIRIFQAVSRNCADDSTLLGDFLRTFQ